MSAGIPAVVLGLLASLASVAPAPAIRARTKASAAPAPQERSPAAREPRSPVPSAEERRAWRERLEKRLEMPALRDAAEVTSLRALVQRLLRAARREGDAPLPERYACLEFALELAERIGDVAQVREIVAALEARFEIQRNRLLLASARAMIAAAPADAPPSAALLALFVEAGTLQLDTDLAGAESALAEARALLARSRGSERAPATREVEVPSARIEERALLRDRLPAAELHRVAPPPEADDA